MNFLNTQNILSFCCAHFFGLLTLVVVAQPEGITWQHTLGAESFEWAGGLDKNESGYVVCGYSNSTTDDFSNNVGAMTCTSLPLIVKAPLCCSNR